MATSIIQQTPCYHYTFAVCDMPPREWLDLEHDPSRITVKIRFWKLDQPVNNNSAPIEADGIECYLCRDEVVSEMNSAVLDASCCLKEIGVPRVCHARMIAKLMQYIESEEHEQRDMVAMDIVETSGGVAEGVNIEMALQRTVYPSRVEWLGVEDLRRVNWTWIVMDMGVRESWEWPEAAEGVLELAVAMLRDMERTRRQYVRASEAAIASLEKVQQGECVICMDDDKLGFTKMPCKHVFHTLCVETWLRISSYCPLCRHALPN